MKVCIFGAGAIGGQLAMRLARSGAKVSVVARGRHLEAIRHRGLRVVAADAEWCEPVAASDDPADLGMQDMVIAAVKQPALPSLARTAGPLLGPDTAVAFVMNGVPWWYFFRHGGPQDGTRLENLDPGNAVWDAIGPERAIGAVVYSAAEVIEPGVVKVINPGGRLILGEPDGTRSARVRTLAETIERGGLRTVVSDAIRRDIWAKILANMASGTLAIATQSRLSDIYADPSCARAARAVVREMAEVAKALGIDPDADPDKEIARGLALDHKPSILQDLERGRPMEIEAIYSSPLAMARIVGMETPMTDLLVAIATLRARAAGLLGG